MGTTTTSLHVLIPRASVDMPDAIAKAIEKLGYKRIKKPGSESGKHVVLACPHDGRFVSLFDRDNARLDGGELRELAALVTHKLKTAALHTSLLDSDSGEVVLYHKGRQVDAVGVHAADHALTRMTDKAREAGWRRVLHDATTLDGFVGVPAFLMPDGVEREARFRAAFAAAHDADPLFADEIVAAWCRTAGLDPGFALATFDGVAADPAAIHFHFVRDATRRKLPASPAATIELRFFQDDEDRPEHLVYPAAWPVRAGTTQRAWWFAVSEGRGFSSVRIRLGIDPGSGLSVSSIALSSGPFHNGQVMGNPVATFAWHASAAQPEWDPREPVEIADFPVPTPATGSRSKQILILRLGIGAGRTADGEVRPVLEVTAPTPCTHTFTPLRFAGIEPRWTPLVMQPLPARRSAADPTYPSEVMREEACLLLNGSGVVSAVAVLAEPDAALPSLRTLALAVLACCSDDARVELRTETRMTESGSTSRSAFDTSAGACMESPNAARMFATPARYQNASIEIHAPGFAAAVAGLMYYLPVDDMAAPALHACAWCIDTPEVASRLGITGARVRALFERWVEDKAPLQGWMDDCAWRPLPETPDGGGATPYEVVAGVYGIAVTHAQYAAACRRRVRYVANVMWLGDALLAHVDRDALQRVATLRTIPRATRIESREDATRADLEQALQSILPGPA